MLTCWHDICPKHIWNSTDFSFAVTPIYFLYLRSFDSWKSCSLSGYSCGTLLGSVWLFKQSFPSTKPVCCVIITWFSWRILWLLCTWLSVDNTQAHFFLSFFPCHHTASPTLLVSHGSPITLVFVSANHKYTSFASFIRIILHFLHWYSI